MILSHQRTKTTESLKDLAVEEIYLNKCILLIISINSQYFLLLLFQKQSRFLTFNGWFSNFPLVDVQFPPKCYSEIGWLFTACFGNRIYEVFRVFLPFELLTNSRHLTDLE